LLQEKIGDKARCLTYEGRCLIVEGGPGEGEDQHSIKLSRLAVESKVFPLQSGVLRARLGCSA